MITDDVEIEIAYLRQCLYIFCYRIVHDNSYLSFSLHNCNIYSKQQPKPNKTKTSDTKNHLTKFQKEINHLNRIENKKELKKTAKTTTKPKKKINVWIKKNSFFGLKMI